MNKGGFRGFSFVKDLRFGFEELILLGIIILNVFDFFEIISPEWDYVKKIVSWTAMGMILYRSRLSELFVGSRRKLIDSFLLGGYFLLIGKDLISYARSALQGLSSGWLHDFFQLLVSHNALLELLFLYLGLVVLIFASLRLVFALDLSRPSIFRLITRSSHRLKTSRLARRFESSLGLRFLLNFVIVLAFFVIVFNLFMEWLAVAVDAPILMIALASYFFFVIKYHKSFSPRSFLYTFGNFGSSFYQNVVRNLKTRRLAFRVLSGVLVLHLLTDALVFLTPAFFGFGDPLYLSLLSQPHPSIVSTLQSLIHSLALPLSSSIILTLVYVFSGLGLFLVFAGPLALWFGLYDRWDFHLPSWLLGLSFSSVFLLLSSKTFGVHVLFNQRIFGLDFFVLETTRSLQSLSLLLLVSLLVGILVFVLDEFSKAHLRSNNQQTRFRVWHTTYSNKNQTTHSTKNLRTHSTFHSWLYFFVVMSIQLLLVVYSLLFLSSLSSYYWSSLGFLFNNNLFVLFVLFGLFFIIAFTFYVFSALFFVEDTHKHAREIVV